MGRTCFRMVSTVLTSLFLVSGLSAQPSSSVTVVTGNFPPYTGSELEEGGPVTKLVVAALEEAGLEASIVFIPWARGYRMVTERSVEGSFPYIRTAEREEEVLFSDPLYTAREVVVVAESSSIEFTGAPHSLEDARYCLPLGYAVQPVLRDLVDRGALQLVRPESLEECTLLVQRGRADFYAPNYLTYSEHRRKTTALRISGPPLSHTDNFLIVPRDDREAALFLQQFNHGLEALRESGKYERLFPAYGHNDPLYGEL